MYTVVQYYMHIVVQYVHTLYQRIPCRGEGCDAAEILKKMKPGFFAKIGSFRTR